MTLDEAKEKFLGKTCNVNWGWPKERNVKMPPQGVVVKEIYENCYGELMFFVESKLSTPTRVERLELA